MGEGRRGLLYRDGDVPLTAEVGGEDGGGVQEQRGGEGELHCEDDR